MILPRLVEENEQFDLVYIDGSHLFEDVFIDTYYTGRLLSQGGVVAFDDCGDPHVRKVLAFLRSNLGDSFEELDLPPFRADQGRSTKYRLARQFEWPEATLLDAFVLTSVLSPCAKRLI
jgi:methyltransferase family protein